MKEETLITDEQSAGSESEDSYAHIQELETITADETEREIYTVLGGAVLTTVLPAALLVTFAGPTPLLLAVTIITAGTFAGVYKFHRRQNQAKWSLLRSGKNLLAGNTLNLRRAQRRMITV